MSYITDDQALAWLEQFPAHPQTDRIRVLDRPANDHEVKTIPWLLRAEFMDAIVMDSPNKDHITAMQNDLAPHTWKPDHLYAFTQDMLYTPNTSDYSLNIHKDTYKEILPGTVLAERHNLDRFISDPQILIHNPEHPHNHRLYCFHATPGNDNTGLAPTLHVDDGLGAYTCLYGAGMEFLTLPLSKQDKTLINGTRQFSAQSKMLSKWFKDAADINDVIDHIKVGQTVVYNDNFIHRSSRQIPITGQLALDISTYR